MGEQLFKASPKETIHAIGGGLHANNAAVAAAVRAAIRDFIEGSKGGLMENSISASRRVNP